MSSYENCFYCGEVLNPNEGSVTFTVGTAHVECAEEYDPEDTEDK
jgi:hypothetical protein